MSITVEIWQLLASLLTIASFLGGFAQFLVSRLDKRFQESEEKRQENTKHWDDRFKAIHDSSREERQQWQTIERELMSLKAELPANYVRREDHIRIQSSLELKIDSLANLILSKG